MQLILIRHTQTEDATLGILYKQDPWGALQFKADTLELPWRQNERNVSCIPADEYQIVLEHSPRFAMDLWELKGVPGRSEIKIHPANYPFQLHGCIAIGIYNPDVAEPFVSRSKLTHRKFLRALTPHGTGTLKIIELYGGT